VFNVTCGRGARGKTREIQQDFNAPFSCRDGRRSGGCRAPFSQSCQGVPPRSLRCGQRGYRRKAAGRSMRHPLRFAPDVRWPP